MRQVLTEANWKRLLLLWVTPLQKKFPRKIRTPRNHASTSCYLPLRAVKDRNFSSDPKNCSNLSILTVPDYTFKTLELFQHRAFRSPNLSSFPESIRAYWCQRYNALCEPPLRILRLNLVQSSTRRVSPFVACLLDRPLTNSTNFSGSRICC